MIEINISRTLGRFHLNIEVKSDSKRIGILGASGCGKSMTLGCIAGIVSHVSTVPNKSSPLSALSLAPGTLSRSHLSLVAEK